MTKLTEKDIYELSEDFINACAFGRLEEVKFLLSHPDYKDLIDIHHGEDYAFIHCATKEFEDILQYFIFEQNIALTQRIEKCIEDKYHLQHMFRMRELNKKFHEEVTENALKATTHKI